MLDRLRQQPRQHRSGWLDAVVFKEMNQLAQSTVIGSIGNRAPEFRLNTPAEAAQRTIFTLDERAEELLTANPAQQTFHRDNLPEAGFANRQPGSFDQRRLADTAIGRKKDGKEAMGGNFDRTFHRIAQMGGAMGNALSPVYDTTTEDLPSCGTVERCALPKV